ncbi:protein kinase [bacterium]|nr:protein kinase [bacterium]
MTDKPEGEATLFLALESICDAFESALQTDSSPRIEDYLPKVGSHQQERLLRELCLIEIQHRIDRKEEVSLTEYAQRFPAHRECLESLAKEHPRWGIQSNPPDIGETLVTNPLPEFTSSSNWQSLETMAAVGDSTDPENPPSCRFGDYELIEKIGQGGMGVIYKARQQKLNRIVAVKMIRAGKLASPSDIQRFQSEAEAIGRLEHPQIVPIYEVDQVEGIHFFSMAFIDGEDLAQKLRQGPLPQRQAAQLVDEIALAIHYAHQQGIIHRDLKPANILLTRDGQIRVTDFGLAKLQDAEHGQTVTGDVVGTPGYMSPEQAAGQRASVGTASDIYSLGAILYSLLTGRPPFQAATMVDTLLQVINDNPVSPRQVNPAIDRDLETICLKCLEKAASRRYPTAQDLSDELQRFIDGHPIEARPVGVLSRVWRWSCRRPKLAAAWSTVAALLLFLSIAGPLVAMHQAQLKTAADQSAQNSLQSAAKYRKEQLRADAKATEAEHALYDTRMILAQSALENNNPGYTRQLLALYEGPSTGDDYRGFEWHFLNQQLHQETCSIDAHPGFAIMDVAIPPPNTPFEFATLGGGGLLRIWTMNGIMKREVSLGPSGGYCMDYNDDGRLLVVGSESGEIRFFDAKTLKQEKQHKVGSEDIFDIDLLPGGKVCVVKNNQGAILSVQVDTGDVTVIARPFMLTDGKPIKEEFGGQRRRFACSSDGNYLAFNDEIRGKDVAVWDLKLSKLKYVVRGTGSTPSFVAPALALSADGGLLVNGDSRGEISVWRPSDGVSQLRYHDHSTFIEQVTITLDDRFIVSAGRDRTIRTTEILGHKKRQVFYGHETHVVCFAVGPNNEFIVSADRAGELKVFSLTGMSNPRKYFTGNERGLAFNPLDASYALANSNTPPTIEIWDKGAQRPTRTLDGHLNKVRCLSFHPRGTELAAGLEDGTIYIWNPNSCEYLRSWKGHESSIESLAYSPDGTRLASTSWDKTLKIWNTSTGQVVQAIRFFAKNSRVSWNDDGTRVVIGGTAGSGLPQSKVIDVASGKTVLVLPGRLGIYTPNGKQLLYVEGPNGKLTNDKTIIVCDALTGKETRRFVGHIMRIDDVIITADSQRAISIDKEKRIAVWNMNTGAQICKLRGTDGDYNPSKLHIGPDGRALAYQGWDTTVWSTGKIADPSQAEESP